jgi:hypothetical protein
MRWEDNSECWIVRNLEGDGRDLFKDIYRQCFD